MSLHLIRLAPRSLYGQPLEQVWIQAGLVGILMLAYRHINLGLNLKLLIRAYPLIPGTLKLDSILSLFKCVVGKDQWFKKREL